MTRLAIALAGGNALGAYHAGLLDALLQSHHDIVEISGTSIGAIMGALVAGNPPERRRHALRSFCDTAAQSDWLPFATGSQAQRLSVLATLLRGCPGLFAPAIPGLAEIFPAMPRDYAIFRRNQMQRALEQHIDADLLNKGDIRLRITAIDAESGHVRIFDNRTGRITVRHLMAATAFPVLFAPVTVDGTSCLDASLVVNLPLDALTDDSDAEAVLAVDLFRQDGPVPESLDAALYRAQDIAFAGQAQFALDRYLARGDLARPVIHVCPPGTDETGLKTLDFSRRAINRRWRAGAADAAGVLDALTDRSPQPLRRLAPRGPAQPQQTAPAKEQTA